MTNRDMVRPATSAGAGTPRPNATPLPAMPSSEGSATPTTAQEPTDSPQPNTGADRAPPAPGRDGLAAERK